MIAVIIALLMGFAAAAFTRSNGWRATWSGVYSIWQFAVMMNRLAGIDSYNPYFPDVFKQELGFLAVSIAIFLVGLVIGIAARQQYDKQKIQDTKQRLSSTNNTDFTKWINNTVIDGRLHNDPWVEKVWTPLSEEQKTQLVASHRRQFLDLHTQMFAGNQLVPYPRIIAMVERALSGEADPEASPDEQAARPSAPDLSATREQVKQTVNEVKARAAAALERVADIVKRGPAAATESGLLVDAPGRDLPAPAIAEATTTVRGATQPLPEPSEADNREGEGEDAEHDHHNFHLIPPAKSRPLFEQHKWLLPTLVSAVLVIAFATFMTWKDSQLAVTQPSPVANTILNEDRVIVPAPGYVWTDISKRATRWIPGSGYGPPWPHVVASDEEGKWQAETGYEFVNDNSGDYTVRPISVSSYDKGLADRTRWQNWLASLNTRPDFERGAFWWSGQRSLPNPGACQGPTAPSQEFISGCEAAKQLLSPMDIQRKSNSEYKRGWNAYK